MTSTAIAVAQFAPGPDSASNLAQMRTLATTAAARGAALVVFPEYSSYFTPVMGQDWVDAAQPIDGEFAAGVGVGGSEKSRLVGHCDDPEKGKE